MRVMGIDPGSHRLGWGIVHVQGNRFAHIASGTVQAPATDLVSRLRHIADHLDEVLARWQPEVAAVENIFHAKNSQSALILGHARGVALLCLGRYGLEIFEYTPSQVKQAATGRGRADKTQVQTMVRLILGLDGALGLDTSDALAVALCHAQMHDSRAVSWLRRLSR